MHRRGKAIAAFFIFGTILVALGYIFNPAGTPAANAQDGSATQIGQPLSLNSLDLQTSTPFFTPTSPPPPTQPASGKDSHLPVILKQVNLGVPRGLAWPTPPATPTVTAVSSN